MSFPASILDRIRAPLDGALPFLKAHKMTVALTAAGCVAVIAIGAIAIAGSTRQTDIVRTEAAGPVRVLGTQLAAGTPCNEQTWPYIESRCLTKAKPSEAERSTPKHGLASAQVALATPLPETQAAAPAASASRDAAETTGSVGSRMPAPIVDVPLPRAQPAVYARDIRDAAWEEDDDAFDHQRPLTRQEWRQLRQQHLREWREMRRLEREAWRQAREARRAERFMRWMD